MSGRWRGAIGISEAQSSSHVNITRSLIERQSQAQNAVPRWRTGLPFRRCKFTQSARIVGVLITRAPNLGAATLEESGFVLVGRLMLDRLGRFPVCFDRRDAQSWAPAIYAFRIGGEIVRIGKCEHGLGRGMRQWGKNVSRALAGEFRKGGTTPWKAFEWRRTVDHAWAWRNSCWCCSCGQGCAPEMRDRSDQTLRSPSMQRQPPCAETLTRNEAGHGCGRGCGVLAGSKSRFRDKAHG